MAVDSEPEQMSGTGQGTVFAVCLVLASEVFDEEDYIYDYDDFLTYIGKKK